MTGCRGAETIAAGCRGVEGAIGGCLGADGIELFATGRAAGGLRYE